jgi:hypothetical protein
MQNRPAPAVGVEEEVSDRKSMLFQLAEVSIVGGLLTRNKYIGYGGLLLLACTSLPDLVRYVKINRM